VSPFENGGLNVCAFRGVGLKGSPDSRSFSSLVRNVCLEWRTFDAKPALRVAPSGASEMSELYGSNDLKRRLLISAVVGTITASINQGPAVFLVRQGDRIRSCGS